MLKRLLYTFDTFFYRIYENPKRIFHLFNIKKTLKLFFAHLNSKKTQSPRQYNNLKTKQQTSFNSSLWRNEGNFKQKLYSSYDIYKAKQINKFNKINYQAFDNREKIVNDYATGFKSIKGIQKKSNVICLAARGGEEVEAFRKLGFFAFGIDLNPGLNNKFVVEGDFHKIELQDKVVDIVYTNSLDHSYDINLILSEVNRILKENSFFICDLVDGYNEGFLPGDHDSTIWASKDDLIKSIEENSNLELVHLNKIHKSKNWHRAVFTTAK